MAFRGNNDTVPASTTEKFALEEHYTVWVSELKTYLFVSNGDICEVHLSSADHYVLTSDFFDNLSHVEFKYLPVYCKAVYGDIETDMTYEDFLYTVTLYSLKNK